MTTGLLLGALLVLVSFPVAVGVGMVTGRRLDVSYWRKTGSCPTCERSDVAAEEAA